MRVPDYISPIVAYRAWQWDSAGLKSFCSEPWHPGRPLAATCRRLVRDAAHHFHEAPEMNCTCGIYAAKSRDDLRRAGYAGFGIHGEVYLWGTVVEHEIGWRAQYACPKNFFLPLEMLPVSMSVLEPRLKTLAAYGCDIHVIGIAEIMPLWVRGSGYDAAALDLLVQRCKGWYAQHARERRIKRGDRVAILGRGIAVVEQADDKEVHVLLWNRSGLRIGRKDIVWDERNMRWETSRSGVPQRPLAMDLACARITGGTTQWTTQTIKGEKIGSLTHAVSNDKSITINRLNDVTTVTTRDRNTGKVASETFIGDSRMGSKGRASSDSSRSIQHQRTLRVIPMAGLRGALCEVYRCQSA